MGRTGVVHAAVGVALLALVLLHLRGAELIDLHVYRMGGRAAWEGEPLYAIVSSHHLPFTYPPFAALLFVPLALLSWAVGSAIWTGLTATCLVMLWRACTAPRPVTGLRLAVLVVASCALEPVWQNFFLGQINVLLALAVVIDLTSPMNRPGRGFLTGLVVGVKLTPAVFLALLLVTGQWRALRNASMGLLATVAVGAVLLPAASATYWLHTVLNTRRIGDLVFANNQSINGALQRLSPGTDLAYGLWVVGSAVVAIACLAVAAAWWRRGEHLLAVSLTALSALFASPVSWTHHWVWCIPLGLRLFSMSRRTLRRSAALAAGGAWYLIFAIAPNLWVPRHGERELEWSAWQHVVGNTYLWAGLIALVCFAVQAARLPPTPEQEIAGPLLRTGDPLA